MAKVNLRGERATLLATLYGRALDAESPGSILHDTMALDAAAGHILWNVAVADPSDGETLTAPPLVVWFSPRWSNDARA